MSLRKTLGILVFSTQAVVAVDYNMQSQKAGLGPGELSMKDYAAIVQKRYKTEPADRIATEGQRDGLWQKATGLGSAIGARLSGGDDVAEADVAAQEQVPASVCIRRGTALNCQ
ncbi:hypothetical protein [Pseudophaeobacter arcticus]|uniref:hypothetical protein n=1 Tax=Pseudophaeobacter arcticus TaxID=385492 RepID=UPI002492B1D3|nr:hypothetical protein [Pseudophaeobacter arcticus]